MKVSKSNIYRITASMNCGCESMQEFKDASYQEKVKEEIAFSSCSKHKGQAGEDIIKMVLDERVEEESKVPAVPPTPIRETPAAKVDDEGNLVQVKVPAVAVSSRVTVGAGKNVPKGTPVRGSRTGPVAPMNPARNRSSSPAPSSLKIALAEEEELSDEGSFADILAATDPSIT